MPIKSASGLSEFWYTPEEEEGDENPTRFKLKPLSQFDLMEVFMEGHWSDDGVFIANHRGCVIMLRKGLRDWEEFFDHNGEPIKFTRSNQNLIPAPVLIKIANKIMNGSIVTDDEKKI